MSSEFSATLPISRAIGTTVPKRDEHPVPLGRDIRSGIRPNGGLEQPNDGSDAAQALNKAVEEAASTMFPGRDIQVQSHKDESSGRFVFRVADKQSGRVIHESPPEALLRFFASGRDPEGGPIVHVDV